MYAAVIDDFVVDRECVPVVVGKKEKIETLFDVVLSLGDVGQDESKREKQWVGLRGTISNRRNAKEYIVALCHPEDHITMKLPPHLLDTLSLRTVEAQTKAAISVDDELSELTISGTDLAVTLAMSAIEDSVDKFKKGRDKEDEKSRREKRLSSEAAVRLDTRFMRALSQHSDGTSMPEDYENAPDYVKRVMLQCWSEDTPNKDDVSDTTDSPGAEMDHSGVTEATSRSQRNHLVHLREQVGGMQLLGSDGFSGSNVNRGQHVASDTPSKKVFDLRDFAKQCGYDDDDIDLALQNPPVNMTPKEFLSKLYENKSLKRHSPLSGKVDPDGPVVPPKLSSNSGGSSSEIIASKSPSAADSSKKSTSEILYARGRGRDMPSAFYADYWQRLARDFQEEDETTDINELKQRNAERQKIIKSALIDQRNSASAVVGDSRPIPSPTQTKNKKSGKKKRAKSASQSPKLNGVSQRDESPVLVDLTKLDSSVEIVDVADRVLVDLTGDTSLDNGRTPQVSGEFDETCVMEVWPSQTVTGRTAYPQTDRRADSQERCARDHSTHRTQRRLRHIIIDGSNVAMTHGNGKFFSCYGIQICVDYFVRRGHEKVTVFVPQWRQRMPTPQYPIRQQQLLEQLKDSGHLVFTPARKVDGRNIVCYDDRYVLRLAEQTDGVIVSNDNYRDLMSEQPSWRKLVQDRLLMYSFVGDIFMPPDDPLGRDGPTLDDFLAADSPVSHSNLASQTRPPFSNRGNFRQPNFTSPPPFSQRPPQQQQHHQRPSWQPKRSKPGRSPEETDHLTTLLRSLFPNREQEDKIRKVLQNHRSETDINKLSNYIMNI